MSEESSCNLYIQVWRCQNGWCGGPTCSTSERQSGDWPCVMSDTDSTSARRTAKSSSCTNSTTHAQREGVREEAAGQQRDGPKDSTHGTRTGLRSYQRPQLGGAS